MNDEKKEGLKRGFKLSLIGIISGIINGFFGAGGGLVIVPMLKKFDNKNSKVVHATTLGCVMFMCLSSSVVYFLNGCIDFKLVLFCTIGSLIGSVVAVKLLKNLKNVIIDLIFSCVLIVAGLSLIFF
jgi:uncharacterized membrane protein YfcA